MYVFGFSVICRIILLLGVQRPSRSVRVAFAVRPGVLYCPCSMGVIPAHADSTVPVGPKTAVLFSTQELAWKLCISTRVGDTTCVMVAHLTKNHT